MGSKKEHIKRLYDNQEFFEDHALEQLITNIEEDLDDEIEQEKKLIYSHMESLLHLGWNPDVITNVILSKINSKLILE